MHLKNYDIFYKFHCDGNFNFTVSSKIRIDTLDYGILTKGREGFLEKFEEKPKSNYLVSMGIYMMSKKMMD